MVESGRLQVQAWSGERSRWMLAGRACLQRHILKRHSQRARDLHSNSQFMLPCAHLTSLLVHFTGTAFTSGST